jgi:peptide/nickel transport system substrate-binding protein
MKLYKTLILGLLLSATAMGASAQDLRIGLAEDPDILDPDQSRTFVGRIVYAALCDKLVDITPDLQIIPQLATEWSTSEDGMQLTMKLREGVVFHDGTPFNAEAVAANIKRSQTLDESRRKSELKSIASTEVIGEYEVRFNLTAPDATVVAQLADRAGMMISPTAAEAAGVDFGANPVCSGPFSFEQRVAQDRIVLKAFPDYWNAEQIHLDSVTYLPIPDSTVRLANLLSGDINILDRMAATDLGQAESNSSVSVARAVSLGYQGLTVNINNGEKGDNPFGNDARVRQALSLAIDRNVINQVVFEGAFAVGNQSFPTNSPWYNKNFPVPERDVAKAKALLAEAGYPNGLDLEIQVSNGTVPQQVTQVIQAMAGEVGINVTVTAKEFATLLADQSAGDYQISQIGWSGRVDPDGNIHQFVTTTGGINDAKYSNPEVDALLDSARTSSDLATRKAQYDAATAILNTELPLIYLYHETWIWGLDGALSGFTPYPDGMIRLEGVRLEK